MPKKEETNDRKIKYLVNDSKGEFVVELPASWKLTFGYVNPASSRQGYAANEGHCLRIWEGDKLRAVYGNVRGFRDLSIPLARKVTKETGSATWTMDSQGNFEEQKKVTVEHQMLPAAEENDIKFN